MSSVPIAAHALLRVEGDRRHARLLQGEPPAGRPVRVVEGAVEKSAKVEGARAALPGLAQKIGTDLLGGTPQGLITGSTPALEAAARCWAELSSPPW